VVDDLAKCLKAAIVIETSFCPNEKPLQRSRSIPAIRRAIGLKIVYANLGAGMHRPSWLSEQRGNVARRTFASTLEDLLAYLGKLVIEGICRRFGRGNG
jgi:hypothetical protein